VSCDIDPLLLEAVAGVLAMPTEALGPRSGSDTLAAWDSLSHLNIVLAVEEAFDIRIATSVIPGLTNLRKLQDALGELGVGGR